MTPEQIRIKIAEACGWTFVEFRGQTLCREPGWEAGSAKTLAALPDYLNDLNAMAEAEKTLPDLHLYRRFLYLVVCEDPTNRSNEPAFATAEQRAESFLRSLSLWETE